MAFFKRLINKIAENMPVVKTGMKSSMTLPGIILQGKDSDAGTKVHEQTHARQQIKDPFFFARYMLDNNYRWRMEKEAVSEQVKYYVQNSLPFDFEYIANVLRTNYRNMASSQQIQEFIEQLKTYGFDNTIDYPINTNRGK
jgi:hypothetical protein